MAPAQHAHFHGARGVVSEVADGVALSLGRLNTSNFSKLISLLLLGCKKPKLRALRKPLGSTCNTRRRNCAPLTVRVVRRLVLLSRQRQVTLLPSLRRMSFL
jgi:hypothetical protein